MKKFETLIDLTKISDGNDDNDDYDDCDRPIRSSPRSLSNDLIHEREIRFINIIYCLFLSVGWIILLSLLVFCALVYYKYI